MVFLTVYYWGFIPVRYKHLYNIDLQCIHHWKKSKVSEPTASVGVDWNTVSYDDAPALSLHLSPTSIFMHFRPT